jgi:hypothetical protein
VTLVVADQLSGDAEHHMAVEVLIVGHQDLRDQRLEARLVGEEMQMGGAVRVTAPGAQHVAHGAIGRHRIAGRPDRAERKSALAVGGELAAQVYVCLRLVLFS